MDEAKLKAFDVVRVLLVDDEPAQSEIVKINLSYLDPSFSIESVDSPYVSIDLIRGRRYECVVSDYQMPGMTGVDLCTAIRKFSTVPFIIYTGRGSEEVASMAFAAGADDYVKKEKEISHFSVLAKRIRHAVERKRYEDLYRISIEDNRDGFALIQGTNFVYANQAMATMLGVEDPNDLIGSSIMKWIVEMERDLIGNRALKRQQGSDEPKIYEYRIKKMNGEIRTLEASVSLINYLGKPASLVFNKDVTNRKNDEMRLEKLNDELESTNYTLENSNAELSATIEELRISKEELNALNEELRTANEQLRASREELVLYSNTLEARVEERTAEISANEEKLRESALYSRNLIEASLDPFLTIDKEGKIADVNEATVKMIGVAREKLIGSDFAEYFTEPEQARKGYHKVFEEGSIRDYPLVVRRASGHLTYVLLQATLYRDPEGEVQGVFAAARDVTNRMRNDERLREAEKNAALGRLTTMLAHDLKNPLNFIYQATDIARTQPEKAERMLQLIKKSAQSALKIIDNLRNLTREITLARMDTDLIKLIRDVAEQTKVSNKISVKMDTPEHMELRIDPFMMRRVLENLVSNAVDAMPEGGIVTLHAHKEGDTAQIDVEDTGSGIADEVTTHIFDLFYTTKPKGLGLGLPLVKRIVEAHGGTLTFKTHLGKGSTFMITLPTK